MLDPWLDQPASQHVRSWLGLQGTRSFPPALQKLPTVDPADFCPRAARPRRHQSLRHHWTSASQPSTSWPRAVDPRPKQSMTYGHAQRPNFPLPGSKVPTWVQYASSSLHHSEPEAPVPQGCPHIHRPCGRTHGEPESTNPPGLVSWARRGRRKWEGGYRGRQVASASMSGRPLWSDVSYFVHRYTALASKFHEPRLYGFSTSRAGSLVLSSAYFFFRPFPFFLLLVLSPLLAPPPLSLPSPTTGLPRLPAPVVPDTSLPIIGPILVCGGAVVS